VGCCSGTRVRIRLGRVSRGCSKRTGHKKTLPSTGGKQGSFESEADGARTRNLRIDSPDDNIEITSENIGKSSDALKSCTNGCTCDRCLMQLVALVRNHIPWGRLERFRELLADQGDLNTRSGQEGNVTCSVRDGSVLAKRRRRRGNSMAWESRNGPAGLLRTFQKTKWTRDPVIRR